MPSPCLLPLTFLGAFVLLAALASFAGAPVSAKAVIIPATPAPFLPPPLFGDWAGAPDKAGITTKRVQPLFTDYGPFKIGENESPLPQDRVFLTYNYYSAVQGDFFVQGFTSVGVATDSVLPVVLFNGIGIGWNKLMLMRICGIPRLAMRHPALLATQRGSTSH